MKKILGCILLAGLCACRGIVPPDDFTYREISTGTYTLASWQKITDNMAPVRIYIEGDGHAFNSMGTPTSDPTPRETFLRRIAFGDPNSNVIYLARPCQYVHDDACSEIDWTTGRFSQRVIDATTVAIKKVSERRDIILIGYSGGALLSGLVIKQNPKMPIKKWITLAGVLNHAKWTQSLKVSPLRDSLDLESLPDVTQIHLIGDNDDVVSVDITRGLVRSNDLIVIPGATHNSGFESDYSIIYGN